MGSIAKNVLQKYLVQLQQHPLRTKAITAAVLSAVSDIVSQKITGIKRLQIRRLLLKVLFGFAYLGPFGHFFHILLDKLFKGKKDTTTVAKKVVLEQVTSSPWNNLLFMIYYGLVIESRPWIQVKSNIKREYPKVQYTSWTGNFLESTCKIDGIKESLKVSKLQIGHGKMFMRSSKIIRHLLL
ncbi:peroxisomal membrane protein PMP22-like isoform X2 [Lycium barbarum]|uniref:peroxisomal membrane protein PMP22-like isoform X2 n=1 Tax=Lycium barbarum TaxID=112863 RepID=UPI00293F2189|nr:peroxisomal membrane protein PMP22-like isoform X2 [Lycium barbarum]